MNLKFISLYFLSVVLQLVDLRGSLYDSMNSDKSAKRTKECAKNSSPESFGLGVQRLEHLNEDSSVLKRNGQSARTAFTVTIPCEQKQKLEVKEIG